MNRLNFKGRWFRLCNYSLIIFGVWSVIHFSPANDYIINLQSSSFPEAEAVLVQSENVFTGTNKEREPHVPENDGSHSESLKPEEWISQIETLAADKEEAPVNARIDPIWKAIPGYNGLRVNTEKTWQMIRQTGALKEDMLVFEQVEPEISLEDLDPAPIYRGNPQKPMVSLMINVAWGTEHLPGMLKTLSDNDVLVTFFLDGQWLKKNDQMAMEMLEFGHEMANHAYSHPDFRHLNRKEIREEIQLTDQLIEKLGTKSELFAPPAGAFDDRAVHIARELGLHTVLWTLDTVDWKQPSSQTIIERILPHLENGALILMHPTEPTAEALPALIEGIRLKGLAVGTVAQMISSDRNTDQQAITITQKRSHVHEME